MIASCPPWASLWLRWIRICLQCRRPGFCSWVWKICWNRDGLPTPVFLGFSCGSAGKQSACSAEDLGSIPGLGRSPGEGKGYPLQYSGLENSMDCIVHGVAKSRTRLSDFDFHPGEWGGGRQDLAPSMGYPHSAHHPLRLAQSSSQEQVELFLMTACSGSVEP